MEMYFNRFNAVRISKIISRGLINNSEFALIQVIWLRTPTSHWRKQIELYARDFSPLQVLFQSLPSTFAIEREFSRSCPMKWERATRGTGLLKYQSEGMRDRWPLASSRNNADL